METEGVATSILYHPLHPLGWAPPAGCQVLPRHKSNDQAGDSNEDLRPGR